MKHGVQLTIVLPMLFARRGIETFGTKSSGLGITGKLLVA